MRDYYATSPPSEFEQREKKQNSSESNLADVSANTLNTTLNRAPKSPTRVPDYVVDNWTKMYFLTPKGIEQVCSQFSMLFTTPIDIKTASSGYFKKSEIRFYALQPQNKRRRGQKSLGSAVACGQIERACNAMLKPSARSPTSSTREYAASSARSLDSHAAALAAARRAILRPKHLSTPSNNQSAHLRLVPGARFTLFVDLVFEKSHFLSETFNS